MLWKRPDSKHTHYYSIRSIKFDETGNPEIHLTKVYRDSYERKFEKSFGLKKHNHHYTPEDFQRKFRGFWSRYTAGKTIQAESSKGNIREVTILDGWLVRLHSSKDKEVNNRIPHIRCKRHDQTEQADSRTNYYYHLTPEGREWKRKCRKAKQDDADDDAATASGGTEIESSPDDESDDTNCVTDSGDEHDSRDEPSTPPPETMLRPSSQPHRERGGCCVVTHSKAA